MYFDGIMHFMLFDVKKKNSILEDILAKAYRGTGGWARHGWSSFPQQWGGGVPLETFGLATSPEFPTSSVS